MLKLNHIMKNKIYNNQGNNMEIVGALVKYNPCIKYARRGNLCLSNFRNNKKCNIEYGKCRDKDYDGWFKDVVAGKVKCFYPNRVRVLDFPNTFLLIFHKHKRAIVGEAKITKSISKDKRYFYYFDKFVVYPNLVKLDSIKTTSKLYTVSRSGRWTIQYIARNVLEEIRLLSGIDSLVREKLNLDAKVIASQQNKIKLTPRGGIEKMLAQEKEKIQTLGLSPKLINSANELFFRLRNSRKLQGRPLYLWYCACLYLACRIDNVVIDVQRIKKLGNFGNKEFSRAVRELVMITKITIKPLETKSIIVNCSLKLPVKKATIDYAKELVDCIRENKILVHRKPSALAAASLYLASKDRQDKLKLSAVCTAFSVSEVTLRKCVKSILKYDLDKTYNK